MSWLVHVKLSHKNLKIVFCSQTTIFLLAICYRVYPNLIGATCNENFGPRQNRSLVPGLILVAKSGPLLPISVPPTKSKQAISRYSYPDKCIAPLMVPSWSWDPKNQIIAFSSLAKRFRIGWLYRLELRKNRSY